MEMAQMSNHVRAGNKIDAIRIYRKTFGTDLMTAKNAVDSLSAGQPILLNGKQGNPATAGRKTYPGNKFGGVMALVIVAFVALIFTLVLRTVNHQMAVMRPNIVIPVPKTSIPTITIPPGLGIATPTAPTFADMIMKFGSEGIGAGQFKDARSIAIDGNGKIYVGDYSRNHVQVFDSTGKFIKVWSIGKEKTSLLNLAASRNGTVYAVTPGHILCFEGSTGLALGEAAVSHDDMQESYMDAFAALSGDIYGLGGESHIVILNSDGQIKSVIDANQKVGETLDLCRVVVNGDGEIYALDRTRGIIKFAPDGRYINRFAGSDDEDHPTSAGLNLAVDGQGRIYVSGGNPAIRVYDGNGKYLNGFGGFDVVFGMAVTDQNEIYACFRNQNEIRKFKLNSTHR